MKVQGLYACTISPVCLGNEPMFIARSLLHYCRFCRDFCNDSFDVNYSFYSLTKHTDFSFRN